MRIALLAFVVLLPSLIVGSYALRRGSALRRVGQITNVLIASALTAATVFLFYLGSGDRSSANYFLVAGIVVSGGLAIMLWGLFFTSLRLPGTVEKADRPPFPSRPERPRTDERRSPTSRARIAPPPPSTVRFPAASEPTLGRRDLPRDEIDRAFDHDRFLLRQRLFSILNERYEVRSSRGEPLLFVERPGRLPRRLLSNFAGLAAGLLVGAPIFIIAVVKGTLLLGGLAIIAGLLVMWLTRVAVFVKRHATFYRDESRNEVILDVQQDQKLVVFAGTFTVRDADRRPIGLLQQQLLTDIWRNEWRAYGRDGRLLCMAKGDPLPRRLYLRLVANLSSAEFVFYQTDSDAVLGRLTRQVSLEDRYLLDMSPDGSRWLDRRLALALGIMIDSLESGAGRP